MPTDLPLIYWDACVPLSYINGEPDRVPHIQGLMDVSGKEFRFVTSVLSIVEVAFAKVEQDAHLLDVAIEARIAKLWEPGSPIELAEVHQLVVEDAKEFMRRAVAHTPEKWSLKAADAIHLATADRLDVKEFHTYDEKLDKFKAITNKHFPIVRPVAEQPALVAPPAPLIVAVPPPPPGETKDHAGEKETTNEDAIKAADSGPSQVRGRAEGGAGDTTGTKEETKAEAATEPETKAASVAPGTCECGCGEVPKTPGARFLPGHDLRKAYNDQKQPETPKPTTEDGLGKGGTKL